MKQLQYLVIVTTEDGPYMSFHSKESLETALSDKDWGDIEWVNDKLDLQGGWGRGLIMKGEVIIPKEKTVVTKFEV